MQSVGHHRMPVILAAADACRLWMSPDQSEPAAMQFLFEPFTGELVVTPMES
ncbi:MAG: hypothetical protein AAGF31_01135 [Planctomycetota bacterium]